MRSSDHRLPPSTTQRRSLFPSSYSNKNIRKNKNVRVKFSPYARQIQIESIQDMAEVDKTDIWWQKSDYDDFAKISRIISKAMLEGGSEVWLLSKSPTSNDGCTISKVANSSPPEATTPLTENATKHFLEVSVFGGAPQNWDLKAVQTFHETRSEWWHKFGHSRRGLEHIASIGEGRQRHKNVRASIRAVLEEQKHQKNLLPEGYWDFNKIRSLYVQQTHWARALAKAMGEFDAEEVRCNFDASRRRPRDFFLKTHLSKDARDAENLPVFMQNVLTISTHKPDLDANTTSQICFRNHPHSPDINMQLTRRGSLSYLSKSREPPIISTEEFPEEKKCESDDVLVSPKSLESPTSLAKKAAGFLGYECDDHDQLMILTGMGVAPFSPTNIR